MRQEIDSDGEAFLPLLHPAGEAQVDFGTTEFYENGVEYSSKHLALSFPHSNARFVQLFKGENLLCLLQGLLDVFNTHAFQKKMGSRATLFAQERDLLTHLPKTRYEMATWKVA
ncbi:MAG: hypothetical protein GX777_05555, partial [Fastidiosipila sp.]|nr:hypothetical protein [Fastidiosipila sp.]